MKEQMQKKFFILMQSGMCRDRDDNWCFSLALVAKILNRRTSFSPNLCNRLPRSHRPKFGLAFQASQSLNHYVECAKLAKKYEFDMVQVYDDLLFKPAWPILFAMAQELRGSGITIGPGVVNPYHIHPALIATHLACLNEEMNGDSFIMIGKGRLS